MKVIRLFLLLSLIFILSCFSWSYYVSRQLKEKHERATLVYADCNGMENFCLWRDYDVC